MMNRKLRTGRNSLLARTALGSVFLAAAMLHASAARAQVSSGAGATLNAGTITGQFTSGGSGGAAFSGHTGANTAAAETSTITLGSNRTLLSWDGFNLTSGDTLNFVFSGNGDIVLNRVDAGAATINGVLNGNIGSTAGAYGGNVWFVAPSGVVFGGNSVVNVGGLLATSGAITGSDFFDGDLSFTFTGGGDTANVRTETGAQLNAHGGTIALVADSVAVAVGSSISDQSAGADSDVLLGGAREYTISFGADAGGDLDLMSWTVPAEAVGSGHIRPITMGGTISSGNVYLAAVNRNVTTGTILVNGNISATGAVANGDGNIVLTAGGGINAGQPTSPVGQAAEIDMIGGTLNANRDIRVQASAGANMNSGLSMIAGRNISVDAADIGLATITAGEDVSLTSDGFALVTSLSFGDDYSITATGFGGSAMQTNLTAPGTGTGDDALRDLTIDFRAGPMSFGGPVSASGNLNVSATGNLSFSGVSSGGDVTLVSGGTLNTNSAPISVGGDYSITAQDFTGGAFNPNFGGGTTNDFSITNTQSSITVGSLSAPGTLTVTALNGGVTVAGALSSTNESISLNAGGVGSSIAINAAVTTGTAAGRFIDLSSAGSVSQNASGAITTNMLSGDAAGAIFLNSASNHIVNLGAMSAYSDIRINDASGGLGLTGDIGVTDGFVLLTTPGVLAAGDVTLSVGSSKQMELTGSTVALTDTTIASRVQFNGPVTVGGTATVGKSNQSAVFTGTVSGDGIAGDDSLSVLGTSVFQAAVNSSLADLSVGGFAVIYANNSIAVGNDLTFSSPVRVDGLTSGPVSISAGGDLVLGTLASYIGNVDLTLTGSTISASGIGPSGNTGSGFRNVSFNGATSLTGDVLAGGTVTFNSPLTLNGSGLRQISAGAATFNAPVTAGTSNGLGLTTTGLVDFNSTVNVGASGLLGIDAGSLDFSGFTHTVGTLAADVDAGGVDFRNSGAMTIGQVGAVAGVSADVGNISVQAGGNISLAQAVTANAAAGGDVTLQTTSGIISGPSRITGDAVALLGINGIGSSDADRVQTAANTLAAGTADISAGVWINEADSVTLQTISFYGNGAGNRYDLVAGGGIAVASTFTVASGMLALDANGGDITIAPSINLGAGGGFDIDLEASGTISSGAGSFLTAEDILLTAANFTGDIFSDFTLLETQDLSITDTAGGLTLTSLSAARDLNVTVSGGGSLGANDLTAARNLTLTASGLYINSPVSAGSGDVFAAATTGDIAIVSGSSVSAGGDVILSAAGNFLNAGGSSAVSAGGRWVIYAADPATSTFDGLDSGQTAIWNQTMATLDPNSVSGDRYVFAYQPTVTFTSVDTDKVYGTDLSGVTDTLYTVSGLHAGVAGAFLGDTAAVAFSGAPLVASDGIAERASVAGGPYAVTITAGSVSGQNGYALTFASDGAITVTPKPITGTASANDKTYDGTTDTTGSIGLSGLLTGDDVGAGGTFTFADKNAGTDIVVTVSGATLTGDDAGNYSLTLSGTALADILQKVITASASANDKTYDGTTDATGSIGLDGVILSDDVDVSGATFTFADRNAGSDKVVTISGAALTGDDAGNYSVTFPASALADIFQKAITASASANDRIYDGTTDATGSIGLDGVILGDDVDVSGATFAFADKNAGTDKTVTISGATLTGDDAGNYSVTFPASALADIFQKAITASASANDRMYDGTTDATGSISLDGVILDDDVDVSGATFAFADRNAGSDKVVTISGAALTGDDAANYSVTLPVSTLADILQKAIAGTVSANDKIYDGTTAATGTIALDGVIAGDDVGVIATLAFADKNAGADKVVTISGAGLSGDDAGNYALTLPASVLADILQKAITGTVTANDKTYDGTTATTGTVALNGVIAGDEVSASGGVFTFADKNAGSDKIVAVSGVNLGGADSGNYTLALPTSVLADILQKAIGATVIADDKTYDATTAATGTVTLDGVVAGDEVDAEFALAFADANAGVGKAVVVSGGSLSGGDAGNYVLTLPTSVLADILKRAITVTAEPASKEGGQPDPALSWTITDGSLVAGESLSGALAREAGEQPGDYAILQGSLAASANYELSFVGSTFTIEVTPQVFEDLQGYLENIGQDMQIDAGEAPLLVIGDEACVEGSEGGDCPAEEAVPTAMLGGAGIGGR